MPIPRLRTYGGPALLSYGFRPFFLLGAIFAGIAIMLWLPMFHGDIALRTAFAPHAWHVHEMLYGYLPAAMTGFLLTAIPNWTGRLPIQGTPLLTLVVSWIAGRLAVALSADIGWAAAALIDVSFLTLVAAAAVREIAAGRNWRNLKVVAMLSVLLLGNVAFHLEARLNGMADIGIRIGIAGIVVLIIVIGGRIIPSFTRNWLARRAEGRMPAPPGRFDFTVAIASAAALALWVRQPAGAVSGGALALLGILHLLRLARWAGWRTLPERMLLVLHIAYAFVPFGFFLGAAAAFGLVAPGAGIHAWTVGAAGTMTLAVMSRATLGHTNNTVTASLATRGIYAAIVTAGLARICAALEPAWSGPLLQLAAITWCLAFFGFAAAYGPVLARPVQSAEPSG
jgi:uncharacterized protein involved in response to NO